ncbi:hypothetical protein GOP47_0025354 [Adiantum capillus-veneris]|uniref:Uncharacterized protein n=1 Tax=Adiantum capillus-veneris TaxID=13818 RepID=A0A9D4Z2W8_ADICA|nr:hypothetical protein GOP47_0025354 [Adiantum capillus-veneris]
MEKEAAAVAAWKEAKRLEVEDQHVAANAAARAEESLALRNMISLLVDRTGPSSEPDYSQ